MQTARRMREQPGIRALNRRARSTSARSPYPAQRIVRSTATSCHWSLFRMAISAPFFDHHGAADPLAGAGFVGAGISHLGDNTPDRNGLA
jgi:hypothetical protein